MKDKIKKIFEKIKPQKENLIPFVLSLIVTIIILLDSNIFNHIILNVVLILELAMLVVILFIVAIMAGFAVIKSLVKIAAGLSLLIFLSQSYCAIPLDMRTPTGDDALKSLLAIGLLYASFYFFQSLYKILIKYVNKVDKDKLSWDVIITIILFVFFILLFIWDIYQVVGPIVTNLCIYK